MPDKIIVSAPGPQGPAGGGGGGGVTDGDKGDLTVSGGGTVYTIDAGAITTAKLADSSITAAKVSKNGVTFEKFQQLTGPVLVGREVATAGDAEALALGSNLSISSGTLQVTLPTAGTGITGNSIFSVDFAPDGTTSNTKAVRADDSRLSDARTPTAHTHALADLQQGGATTNQVVTWNGSAWAPSSPSGTGTVTSVTGGTGLSGGTITTSGTLAVSYGTTSGTACEGNDSRLSDARTPTSHTHAPSEITQGGATTGQVLEWSGSAWAPATPSGGGGGGAPPVNKKHVVFEHFLTNSTPPRDMVYAAVGGSVGNADIRADGRMGGVNITTGSTATADHQAVWRMANTNQNCDFEDLASAQYSTEIKGMNLANGTTTGNVRVGLGRFVTAEGNGVYFRSTDGGNWYAVTRSGSTETATDTGVAVNTTTWQRLTCKYTSSSCTFYIDGVLKATHTTNIPTTECNFGMIVHKTAAVANQIRYSVDWLYAELEYGTALDLD